MTQASTTRSLCSLSGTTSIVGSTFSKSTGTAIFVHSSAVTGQEQFGHLATEIGRNNDPAIVVTSSSLDLANLVGDSLSGTGNVGFQIDGTLGTSGTLPAQSYPWEIGLASSAGTVGSVTVPSGSLCPFRRARSSSRGAEPSPCKARSAPSARPPSQSSSRPSTMTLWVERTIQVARHTPTGGGSSRRDRVRSIDPCVCPRGLRPASDQ